MKTLLNQISYTMLSMIAEFTAWFTQEFILKKSDNDKPVPHKINVMKVDGYSAPIDSHAMAFDVMYRKPKQQNTSYYASIYGRAVAQNILH